MLGDTDVTHLPPYQRGLGMVVQNYALFPHMKVEDNVAFGLRAQKQPKTEIAARVKDALKIVGMADYASRYPHQLSGGPATARRDCPRHRRTSAGLTA
ncbi:2-aminoethylphosphonate ABC transporter ATP-binding protein [Klebsiella oxytoca]|nr:2-aminoethylphosphonate ABC transporter ATP-binding protein [Klebsiella oxytoca]